MRTIAGQRRKSIRHILFDLALRANILQIEQDPARNERKGQKHLAVCPA